MGADSPPERLVTDLREAGVERGHLVALAIVPGQGIGWAAADRGPVRWIDTGRVGTDELVAPVARAEEAIRPRWVWWSRATASELVAGGVRVASCWDVTAVQRMLDGRWRLDPAAIWAHLNAVPDETIPRLAPVDLFTVADGDADEPVRHDGHVRPDWVAGAWADDLRRAGRWAQLAWRAARLQHERLASSERGAAALFSARAESATELLCVELGSDGLPVDRAAAEAIVARFAGERPRSDADETRRRAERDHEVLRLAAPGASFDLRNPAQVKSLLRSVGVEVPDTRAWRLESLRGAHPAVDALLAWRKAERIATTFGYGWLDEHVGEDGRLRGEWSASDGAAGRMTASAGLHNMPAALRPAVVAEPGHVFVRADLGQIEPRVLAAISGDAALAHATADDDMYAPVARQLGVDRATAKVAVLGAMYGQTTGHGAQALRRLEAAYPVAMRYLHDADLAGQAGRDLRTSGGRLIRLAASAADGESDREARSRAAARGRYARNAMVQGAAAELFKVWAVTVRARVRHLGAQIVLCLHDELLVHAPVQHGEEVADLLVDCLAEAAHRWAPDGAVRFVADVSVVARWSDATS